MFVNKIDYFLFHGDMTISRTTSVGGGLSAIKCSLVGYYICITYGRDGKVTGRCYAVVVGSNVDNVVICPGSSCCKQLTILWTRQLGDPKPMYQSTMNVWIYYRTTFFSSLFRGFQIWPTSIIGPTVEKRDPTAFAISAVTDQHAPSRRCSLFSC